MDLSLILPSAAAPPRLTGRKKLRYCRRIPLTVRSVASELAAEQETTWELVSGGRKELEGAHAVIDALPPSLRLAGSVAVVAGALVAGYGLGARLGASRMVGIGGAVALGAASGAAVYTMNAMVPEVAAVSLHNLVASYDDPKAITKEDVEAIAKKYGVSKDDAAFSAELCDLYGRYLSSVLPPGGEELKGDEVEKIIKFKNGLGIDDPEAASVHLEMGRRIFRERLETGSRDADVEQRRAFQKLVYVSALVFGEASKFLLPWKRIFKVTDAQVELAIRDNAQRLYALRLNSVNGDIDEKLLLSLREWQLHSKLSNEIAAEMFRERTRKLVEENISAALVVLKSWAKARGSGQAVEELEKVLSFNNSLTSLSQHSEAGRLAVGLGPVSLLGGPYDGDRKRDDLKLLYRVYATESFASGRFDQNKIDSLNQLRNIFGFGIREAEAIVLDVTSKVYKKRLSQAVSGGDLDIATSKAAYLQNLCEELQFDPQRASEIHKDIYRQKLQNCLSDGELSQDDVSALLRLRVMLCIPQATVDAAHKDVCGAMFEKVLKDAIRYDAGGYDEDARASVRKAIKGLRLDKDVAMEITRKAVQKVFLGYIQRSQSSNDRGGAAIVLKNMIKFNTVVATHLVAEIKGEPVASFDPELVKKEDLDEEDREWESLLTLKKTKRKDESQAQIRKPFQTEITLKGCLSENDRIALYGTYLMYCLTGTFMTIPVGLRLVAKTDDSEFLHLNQLGQILGLSDKQIVKMHRNLAEQTFMKKAEAILSDGNLTKDRIEHLNEVQTELGLPARHAQMTIKKITTTKIASAIEKTFREGKITIKEFRELKETGIDLEGLISKNLRENLFRKTVNEVISSGTGEFDEEELYVKIPKDLGIDAKNAKKVVQELAKTKISNSLVEAVALLRQRKQEGCVSSLGDILACDKAVPSEPLSWSSPDEIADLYCIYFKSAPKPEKLSRLQYLLGLSDTTAHSLRDVVERGQFSTLESEEEEFVF